ncbi:MAG: ATP-grasp domain-containing protein [Thaumarchaeota archaeon]|nr:ATP-grasp domain-containing protein [Nitrososphaerota archaeon]
MKRTVNVVVTAAGTVVGQGIIKCLKLANTNGGDIEYRITATDASPLAAGLYRGDFGVVVPLATDPGFVEAIIGVTKKSGATAIYAGSDEELPPLSSAKEKIERETGAKVMVNPAGVLEACSDKWKTYVFLKENDLPRAESAVPEFKESFYSVNRFPLVVKPRGGHGSVDMHVVRDRDEAELAMGAIVRNGSRPLIQEYLGDEGMEFTTGVTVTSDGEEVMSSIAMRRTLKGGQTYKAFIDDFAEVRVSAENVALKLGARGPLNIQSRLVDGEPKIFEINPRLSASSPMRAVAGVNEPDMLYRNAVLGERPKVTEYQKLVAMRYWNEVYVRQSTFQKTEKEREFVGPDSVVLPYF